MNSRMTLVTAALVFALAAVAPVAAFAQVDADRGEVLYGLCTQCHGAAGEGNPAALAPAIAGLSPWYVERQLRNFREGKRGTHPGDVGGMRMRPMALTLASDADVLAVTAYVASLPPVEPQPVLEGGDPKQGEVLFVVCKECHGPDATGNQERGAPPLNHASDWYMFTQIGNFRAGIRGADPTDVNGIQMRAMSMTLADEQAMKDVIAYILTLGD
jgi:cytochrome c553